MAIPVLLPFLPELIVGASVVVSSIASLVTVHVVRNKKREKLLAEMDELLKKKEEDENQLQEEMKQRDLDLKTLLQKHAEKERILADRLLQLQRDLRDAKEHLQSGTLMAEQQNCAAPENVKELEDLIESFLDCCEMFADDSETMIKETKKSQRKIMHQLTKIKNSIEIDDMLLPRFQVWAKGAVFSVQMLTYLFRTGQVQQAAIHAAGQQYRRAWSSMVSTFSASNALPCNVEEIRAVEDLFLEQLQRVESSMNRASPAISSPPLVIQTQAAATSGNIHSPTLTEGVRTGGEASTSLFQRNIQFMPLPQSVLDDQPAHPGNQD